jgi:hypothetical protein
MGSENTLLVVGANPGSSNTFSEDGDQRHEGSEVCGISSEFELLRQTDEYRHGWRNMSGGHVNFSMYSIFSMMMRNSVTD